MSKKPVELSPDDLAVIEAVRANAESFKMVVISSPAARRLLRIIDDYKKATDNEQPSQQLR